jgi:predicted ribosome quality control (RQC) complex YloA/Tae2 family protein
VFSTTEVQILMNSLINPKPQRNPRFRPIEYTLSRDWKVLVGRTDADNDYLSLKVARPDDRWFHVRGVPGSHVILQGPAGAEPDRETLKRAAAIAAYHSKARSAGLVAVSCTQARYVTKPRTAKPGTVQIRKEVVFKVRPALGAQAVDND